MDRRPSRFISVTVLIASTMLTIAGVWNLAVGFGVQSRSIVIIVIGIMGIVSSIAILKNRRRRH